MPAGAVDRITRHIILINPQSHPMTRHNRPSCPMSELFVTDGQMSSGAWVKVVRPPGCFDRDWTRLSSGVPGGPRSGTSGRCNTVNGPCSMFRRRVPRLLLKRGLGMHPKFMVSEWCFEEQRPMHMHPPAVLIVGEDVVASSLSSVEPNAVGR
jgi:hypothetical protein